MADSDTNSAMEGKELSLEEKIKAIIEETQKDENGNILGSEQLEINGNLIELSIEKDEKSDKYKIHMFGVHILTLDENNELSFKEGWEKELEEVLNSEKNISIETKNFINSLKNMEIELEKKKEKDKSNSDGEEKDEAEEDEKKPELEEDKKEDEKAQEQNQNTSKDNLIPLNTMMFITLMPEAKEYKSISIDRNTNQIVGRKKGEKEFEPLGKLEDIGYNSTTMNICGIEEGEHKDIEAIAKYKIRGRDLGFAVTRDGTEKGNLDLKVICKPRESNNEKDFRYINMPMLESNGQIGIEQVKQRGATREGWDQGSNISEAADEMHGIDDENRLGELQKPFEEEMNPEGAPSIDEMKEKLVKVLVKEKGMREITARDIANKIIDEDKTLSEAEAEVEKGEEPRPRSRI